MFCQLIDMGYVPNIEYTGVWLVCDSI